MSNRPALDTMIYWRFKEGSKTWRFGYVTPLSNSRLLRLGEYNGDSYGGMVVDPAEIEWRAYR